MNKKDLSERDISTKFITPAIEKSGWDKLTQLLEEVSFTDGKIYVRGKMTARGARKRADYILYYKPNIPIAIVEAKDNKHSVRAGIQQALDYAKILDIPCVFSSNGDGFVFHDRTATDGNIEIELDIDSFPTPEELWQKYKKYKGIETPEAEKVVAQDYYFDASGRNPRYYRMIDKSYEVYLALYQGLSGADEQANAYKQFSPEFFDLIVIEECHRGSAKEDSAWREILTYFKKATHIGLTAAPKETNEVSNSEYFGEPLYIYSLKQGIDDGFLAPYRVVRVNLNVDAEGWRPEQGKKDKDGNEVEDRVYNQKYGEQARKVLETLLDKYADEGVANIESMDILKVKPLTDYGSPLEIIKQFGSKAKYLEAVKELEQELYKTAL